MRVTRDLSPSQLLLLSWCFMSTETKWRIGDRQTFIANSYGVHMAPMCNCINQHLYMHIKISNICGHAVVWTHENSAHTGRNGYCWSWFKLNVFHIYKFISYIYITIHYSWAMQGAKLLTLVQPKYYINDVTNINFINKKMNIKHYHSAGLVAAIDLLG